MVDIFSMAWSREFPVTFKKSRIDWMNANSWFIKSVKNPIIELINPIIPPRICCTSPMICCRSEMIEDKSPARKFKNDKIMFRSCSRPLNRIATSFKIPLSCSHIDPSKSTNLSRPSIRAWICARNSLTILIISDAAL